MVSDSGITAIYLININARRVVAEVRFHLES